MSDIVQFIREYFKSQLLESYRKQRYYATEWNLTAYSNSGIYGCSQTPYNTKQLNELVEQGLLTKVRMRSNRYSPSKEMFIELQKQCLEELGLPAHTILEHDMCRLLDKQHKLVNDLDKVRQRIKDLELQLIKTKNIDSTCH